MNERRGRAHTSCFPPGLKTWTVSIRIDGGVGTPSICRQPGQLANRYNDYHCYCKHTHKAHTLVSTGTPPTGCVDFRIKTGTVPGMFRSSSSKMYVTSWNTVTGRTLHISIPGLGVNLTHPHASSRVELKKSSARLRTLLREHRADSLTEHVHVQHLTRVVD